jgi:hypothetical protein
MSINESQTSTAPEGLEDAKTNSKVIPTSMEKLSTGILISEVRIRHFHCLRSVDVKLDPLTVLIGQNNSGKTSFLNALFEMVLF